MNTSVHHTCPKVGEPNSCSRLRSELFTSNDRPDLSNSSILRATSQLCETIGSGSLENSSRRVTLWSSRIQPERQKEKWERREKKKWEVGCILHAYCRSDAIKYQKLKDAIQMSTVLQSVSVTSTNNRLFYLILIAEIRIRSGMETVPQTFFLSRTIHC